jgi:hypothetical protein
MVRTGNRSNAMASTLYYVFGTVRTTTDDAVWEQARAAVIENFRFADGARVTALEVFTEAEYTVHLESLGD